MMRLGSNGLIDSGFGSNGLVITSVNGSDNVINALALQADGKILAGGPNGQGSAIIRYNSDGTPDTTFGNNSRVATAQTIRTILEDSGGRIVITGTLLDRMTVGRLTPTGSVDITFNNGGTYSALIPNQHCIGHSAALQADGGLIVGGSCYDLNAQLSTMAVVRLVESDPFSDLNSRADFDGDGKTDVSFYRPSEGNWYLNRSRDGVVVANWEIQLISRRRVILTGTAKRILPFIGHRPAIGSSLTVPTAAIP